MMKKVLAYTRTIFYVPISKIYKLSINKPWHPLSLSLTHKCAHTHTRKETHITTQKSNLWASSPYSNTWETHFFPPNNEMQKHILCHKGIVWSNFLKQQTCLLLNQTHTQTMPHTFEWHCLLYNISCVLKKESNSLQISSHSYILSKWHSLPNKTKEVTVAIQSFNSNGQTKHCLT